MKWLVLGLAALALANDDLLSTCMGGSREGCMAQCGETWRLVYDPATVMTTCYDLCAKGCAGLEAHRRRLQEEEVDDYDESVADPRGQCLTTHVLELDDRVKGLEGSISELEECGCGISEGEVDAKLNALRQLLTNVVVQELRQNIAPFSIDQWASTCHGGDPHRCAHHIADGLTQYDTGHDAGADASANDWLTANGQKQNAFITIDLGERYADWVVDELVIFNQNEYGGGRRDVKKVGIYASSDGPLDKTPFNASGYEKLTDCSLVATNGPGNSPANSCKLVGKHTAARFWRVVLTEFYTGDPYSGLTEVQVFGTPPIARADFARLKPQNIALGSVTHASTCHNGDRCSSNLTDGNVKFNVGGKLDWLTANGKKVGAYATIDVGEKYKDWHVVEIVLYNQNEYDASNRDVKSVTLQKSTQGPIDAAGGYTVVRTCGPLKKTQRAKDRANSCMIDEGNQARFWRVVLDAFWSGDAYSGLMEFQIWAVPP